MDLNTDNERDDADQRAAERLQALNDLRSVLRTDPGRRVLYRILKYCHLFSLSYGTGAVDFLEGQRSVGLKLLADIEAIDDNGHLLTGVLMNLKGNSSNGG